MDNKVAQECTRGSLDGTLTFPEVVRRLEAAGVEGYFADLVQLRKVHYGEQGETWSEPLPLEGRGPIAAEFDEAGVKDALRAVQQREIDYPGFLRRIVKAGTFGYHVFIRGRRTVYLGRKGELHVEKFPDPRS